MPGAPPTEEDRNHPSYAPPKLTSGDPLAGLTTRAILSAMRPYEGLLTAMVTPFRADGSVDEEGAVAIGRHLLNNGSHGLVVAGTTGEAATMTDEEHLGLIELIVSELGDEGVVIGGTGSNDTRHAIHLTEKAVEAGVDAVLSVTPYYNKPNRRGLLAHFREVAQGRAEHADRALQHPRPHGDQHAARTCSRSWRRSTGSTRSSRPTRTSCS